MTDMKEPNIKIYVACHKPSYVPENPYLYPIQVGAALSAQRLDGMLHDDEGDSISEKNKCYCELSAQYWAWKNDDADYYGFFHYRRYFSFDQNKMPDDIYGNIVYDRISDKAIEELQLQPEHMRDLITKYDVITVRGRKYPKDAKGKKVKNIYEEYGQAAFQHREDLDIALKVLREKYPEFSTVADTYMQSDVAYECNMFIMKRETYKAYCEWLFDILFETEKRLDTTWYSVEEYRVIGYIAERLCGIYCAYLRQKGNVRYTELTKTLFRDTAPKAKLNPVFSDAVPIVLSANDRFAPYLDVMLRSVVEHASSARRYDIIILYNDISERSQRLLRMASSGKDNISIRFVRVSEYFDAEKLFTNQHLSVETYYRLIIPEIMPDYHKILYLDCDMVAERDVAELYDIDLKGNLIAAAKDIDVAGQINLDKNGWRSYATEVLGLDSPFDYFQAGVLILNLDGLRKITTSEKLIEMALTHKYRCHDQDIMNIVCKNRVIYLPQQWNVLMAWKDSERARMDILKMAPRQLYDEYMSARQKPYIIHFAGYQKPWDIADCDYAEAFWQYAKQSPWYELLIHNIRGSLSEQASVPAPWHEPLLWKISTVFLPYGSRRREDLKKFLGVGHAPEES